MMSLGVSRVIPRVGQAINFAHGEVMMVGVYVGYAVAFLLGPSWA